MRGIKEVWNSICRIDKKIIQKIYSLIASCLILVAIVSAGFMSCTPNFNADMVASRIDNSDRNRDRDDDDDEDDGEKCLGHETCEEICEEIYDSGRDQVACQEEGINKVSRMDKVYALLEKGTSRDFEKIFPDEDGVDLGDLEDYLEVGISGVERLINDDDSSDPWENTITARADFLKWIIDERDVAEVLNGLDDSGGHLILEELLDKMAMIENAPTTCITGTGNALVAATVCDSATSNNTNNYSVNGREINVCTDKSGDSVAEINDLDTGSDEELYKALSCPYSGLSSSGNYNVFSYASRQQNNVLFEMAYELLDSICKEVEEVDHQTACRKALLCWTGASISSSAARDDFFDEYVREYRDDLEKERGGANFDECEPSGFTEFF